MCTFLLGCWHFICNYQQKLSRWLSGWFLGRRLIGWLDNRSLRLLCTGAPVKPVPGTQAQFSAVWNVFHSIALVILWNQMASKRTIGRYCPLYRFAPLARHNNRTRIFVNNRSDNNHRYKFLALAMFKKLLYWVHRLSRLLDIGNETVFFFQTIQCYGLFTSLWSRLYHHSQAICKHVHMLRLWGRNSQNVQSLQEVWKTKK